MTDLATSAARSARLLAPLALVLGSACGPGAPGPAEPPYSGLLVTLDTTRADALTPYGNREEVTPALARFATEGVVYERAHTVTPLTLPSHASMLTGLYPPRHTVRDNGLWALPSSAETLAEQASARGYDTAAFLAAVVLDDAFGLAQGFDTYVAPSAPQGTGQTYFGERPAGEVVEDAIRWLEARDGSRPFFLWVHLFDPHGPHEPPEGFREGALERNPYHGEVAYADHELARLFEWMRADGLFDETYVAVASDHGEAFGENGVWSHGQFVYQPTMRVPLILRDPAGHRAGERSRELVSVVDLYPTLGEAMGIPPSEGPDGLSLFRRTVPEDRGVYVEAYNGYLSFGWSPLAGWIQGDRKYLHSSEPELYDLRADATESRNLFSVRGEEAATFQQAIDRLYQRSALPSDGEALESGERPDLGNLGYVTLAVPTAELPHPLETSDRPSPRSMIATHKQTLMAMNLNNRGRLREAEQILREVLEQTPQNHFARNLLGFCLMRQERHAEAIPLIEAVTRDGPQWPDTWANLGICYAVVERFEDSEAAFERALEMDPTNVTALFGMKRLMTKLEREEEAAALHQRWLEASGEG